MYGQVPPNIDHYSNSLLLDDVSLFNLSAFFVDIWSSIEIDVLCIIIFKIQHIRPIFMSILVGKNVSSRFLRRETVMGLDLV